MTLPALMRRRVAQQRLTQQLETPEQVVAWLGAVQSQEYPGGLWSVGLRMQGAREEQIERAYNEGRILRTHILRPTWHFVTPADIRWMLDLTAPRVKVSTTSINRQLEIDAAVLSASYAILTKALEGGQHRTRTELGAALTEAGIAAHGQRLNHLVIQAELDRIVCSGPRRGKQLTYALFDERVPQAQPLPREEALAQLARRYFAGHGPATLHDFSWWSGLTLTEAKLGIALIGTELAAQEIDGQTFWFTPASAAAEQASAAHLLPTFDELVVGYAGFDKNRRGGGEQQMAFESPIVFDGRIIGSWKRTLKKASVQIEIAPFAPLSDAQSAAVAAAAERYGAFLGLAVEGDG